MSAPTARGPHPAGAAELAAVIELPLSALALDPDHPRATVGGADLEALAASLRAHGVLQPLLVSPLPDAVARLLPRPAASPTAPTAPHPNYPDPTNPTNPTNPTDPANLTDPTDDVDLTDPTDDADLTDPPALTAPIAPRFLIIAGGRRWAAAHLAGLATVPALVRTAPLSPSDRLMMQLDENDGELRRGLTLYERSRAVARALALSRLTKADFARRHHKSPAWCSHYLRLAAAAGPLGDALREGLLNSFLGATLFERLAELDQQRLLATARRTASPITIQQIEVAAQRGIAARIAAATAPAGELDPAVRWVVRLTAPQLDDLLVRLGRRPRGGPGERIEQLYACLN